VFDYCSNFEFFNEHPEGVEGSLPESLGAKLFRHRLDLFQAIRAQRESEATPKVSCKTARFCNSPLTEAGNTGILLNARKDRFLLPNTQDGKTESENGDNKGVRARNGMNP